MLATVAWLGGLAVYSLFLLPLHRRNPESKDIQQVADSFDRYLDALGWFSILVLLISGMLQMSSSPNYQGLLNLNGRWAYSILIKHIFFIVMGWRQCLAYLGDQSGHSPCPVAGQIGQRSKRIAKFANQP